MSWLDLTAWRERAKGVVNCLNEARWTALWKNAQPRGSDDQVYKALVERYSERHRYYHNARHIDECLGQFDRVRGDSVNPIALELSIWFHDVIYDPQETNNEEQSAQFAFECLRGAGQDLISTVSDLILTTKTHAPGNIPDADLLIDIDLSILGASVDRFAEYEKGIREEYSWVPLDIYRKKRAAILRDFLKRERIYATKYFHDRLEETARNNLSKSICSLELSS